ncbi:MATE efflux family protein [Megamonas hypermegale]|uniref:MATE efflux family protein n=1 Tax=Megamonas hypermegale TaxID=158847 RepID=A0A239T764_9FIRM|nr:oligosaccharide flippase family protein [Megamonas hypermegale]SNU93436.1 MATE efflux family protein [Megamonas hypermegale]
MKETNRLLKNTGIIAIGNLSTKAISFLLLPLYTAILSTHEYGIIDYIITLSMFCVPCISFLMDEAIFRFLIDCKNKEEKSIIISNSFILVFIGIILFLVIIYPILVYVKYKYIWCLILFVISDIIATMISALLRGIGRTDAFAVYNFISSTIQIVLNIIFIAVFYWGIEGMLSAMIIGRVVATFVYIICLKLWQYIDLKKINILKIKEMLKYAIPLIPNRVSWLIINLSSRIVIMNIMTSGALGIYAISSKFANLMDMIYGFFYQSWKESSARVLQSNDRDDFYNLVYKYLKSFMYSIVLLITSFIPIIFRFLIADTYLEAILYVPILLLATYFSNISGFYGGIFTAYKDTKIMGTSTIVAATINLVLMFIIINFWGLYAVAISALIANIAVYQYRKIKVKKYVILIENRKKIIFDWIMTGIIFLLFYSMNINLQIIGILVSVVYFIIMNYAVLKLIKNKLANR